VRDVVVGEVPLEDGVAVAVLDRLRADGGASEGGQAEAP
jgi:hypothetical protein